MKRMFHMQKEGENVLRNSVLIDADAVTEYFFRTNKEKESWNFDDFPNLAPVFPSMFVEGVLPEAVNTEVLEAFRGSKIHSFGMLLKVVDDIDPNVAFKEECKKIIKGTLSLVNKYVPRKFKTLAEVPPFLVLDDYVQRIITNAKRMEQYLPFFQDTIKWKMSAKLYISDGEKMSAAVAEWNFYVLPNGSIAKMGGDACSFGGAYTPSKEVKDVDQYQKYIYFCSLFQNISLMTVSFLHCKNVELVERPFDATEEKQLRKPKHSSENKPSVKSYTLVVEPMKKILKSEGDSGTVGLKQAVHICRGHFKNYQEKGLFGKYKGLFWWDMCVKGDKGKGVINKDYQIKI